jgi:hypothetical protein
MDSISDSDSEDAGSIPAGTTDADSLEIFSGCPFLFICTKESIVAIPAKY